MDLQEKLKDLQLFLASCQTHGLSSVLTFREIMKLILNTHTGTFDQEVRIGTGPDTLELRLDVNDNIVTISLEDENQVIDSFVFGLD